MCIRDSYCKAQLVELQDQLETLKEQGLGVAAISYDSVEVLSDFAQRRGITFPLLADDDSSVITEFGILNTVAAEGVGDNADDPDVQADVAKYVSAFGANPMIVGTPYPGTFMVDGDGKVTSRFFEEFYRERNTTTNVMLKLGMGLSPIAAVEGETAHLKFTAYPSNTSVTVGTRFSLALDVTPGPKMHVYAPGAEEKGYKVIGFNLDQPEIARIELRSTLADVISIRAKLDGSEYVYSVVDEHEDTYSLFTETSSDTFTLDELVDFIDHTEQDGGWGGGLSLAYNNSNADGGMDRESLEDFTTISSEIYPQLEKHYDRVFADWVAEENGEGVVS